MRKPTRTSPKRYALKVFFAGTKTVKQYFFNSLRSLRAKFRGLLASLPSCDRVVAIRRTDGFEFGHRRGLIAAC